MPGRGVLNVYPQVWRAPFTPSARLRCHHHQSRNRFTSHSLGVFETAWAAVGLQGCTSCCVQRCHQPRLSHRGGRICPAQGWLSSQCCCVTITTQCLSFPTWAARLLKVCKAQAERRAERTLFPRAPPHIPFHGNGPKASPDAFPVGCRGQVACLARSTASWSPAAPCSPTWPARGPCSSQRWAARTLTPLSSSMTSPRKATPTSTMPTTTTGWRGKGW